MLPDILCYIALGLITGLSEFLPVSASGHEQFLLNLLGLDSYTFFIKLFVYLGCLAAVLLRCGKRLAHIRREQRIASLPAKRRKRQADTIAVLDGRLLRTALVPMLLGMLLCHLFRQRMENPLLLAGMLFITGLFAYVPQFFPGGNRESRGMSALDGFLMGLCGGVAMVPGLSRMGAMVSVGQLRLWDRKYAVDMALLLSVPAVGMMAVLCAASAVTAGSLGLSFPVLLGALLAGGAAFAGGWGAISLVRYLAVRLGFAGFAYFSFGLAMLQFVLYLMT